MPTCINYSRLNKAISKERWEPHDDDPSRVSSSKWARRTEKGSWNNRWNKKTRIKPLLESVFVALFRWKENGVTVCTHRFCRWNLLDQCFSYRARGAISQVNIKECIMFPDVITVHCWSVRGGVIRHVNVVYYISINISVFSHAVYDQPLNDLSSG